MTKETETPPAGKAKKASVSSGAKPQRPDEQNAAARKFFMGLVRPENKCSSGLDP
jgi:hypothetical protein